MTQSDWMVQIVMGTYAAMNAFRPGTVGFIARNEGLDYDISADSAGLRVRHQEDDVGLTFTGWGREGSLGDVQAVAPVLDTCSHDGALLPEGDCVKQLMFDHGDDAIQWVENNASGVEQGWTLKERPEGVGPVVLDLSVDGARPAEDGDAVSLTGPSGTVYRYHELAAWDAHGKTLPAWFEVEGDTIHILVDDADATWPIEIDPVMDNGEDVTLSGTAATGYLGISVASAGDVDADGVDDVIVGSSGEGGTGAARIYYGGAPMDVTADVTITGTAAAGLTGRCVAAADDLNHDGFGDVAVGSPGDGGGVVRVYYGGATMDGIVDVTFTGASAGSNFGRSVANAGDVNADGYDDLIIGAFGENAFMGAARLYFGGSTMDSVADLTISGTVIGQLGRSVAGAGDVNGDGVDDVIIGSYVENSEVGAARVYYGGAAMDNLADVLISGSAVGGRLGYSVSRAGDVNVDGYGDFIVGSYYENAQAGAARIYFGGPEMLPSGEVADVVIVGTATGGQMGESVAYAGDTNGDGVDDVIVGSFNETSGSGAARIYNGGDTLDNVADVVISGTSGSLLGYSVAGAGDVNGDGVSDVIVGAHGESTNLGTARIYLGSDDDVDNDLVLGADDCDDDDPAVGYASTRYLDGDSDGYGTTLSAIACPADPAYADNSDDCNDDDDTIHPGQVEYCDGVDNDCDGTTDGTDAVDPTLWYEDLDDDFYGNPDVSGFACDLPDHATYDNTDCDDGNTAINPDTVWYADSDSDGFGDAASSIQACEQPADYTSDATDCDDTNSAVSPSAIEACNLLDDDCDSLVDESGSTGELVFYADIDQDGHGDLDFPSNACFDTGFTAESDDDCDDTVVTTYPGASEYCNEVDDDCNGIIDDPTAIDAITWYRDLDGDGYGVSRRPVRACEIGPGYATNSTDCRAADAASYPGAPELCDGYDNDCDATVDEPGSVDQPAWYTDADGDTFGAGAVVSYACTQPSGLESTNTDCNDGNLSVNPGAIESCNTIDDDCDGSTDEAGAAGEVARYLDVDGDLYGDPATALFACDGISGRISDGTDCNDALNTTYPGAPERCDGVQNDCEVADWTTADEDGEVWLSDGDDWTSYTSDWSTGTDGHPTVLTLPADGILNVCAGTYYVRLTASLSGTLSVEGTDGDAVLSAGGVGSVVTVSGASAHLELLGLTMEDGAGSGSPRRGGGLRVTAGTVTVDDCLLQDSTAASGGGFAVLGGAVTMTNSEVSYNNSTSTAANTGGGGWYQSGGTLTLTDTDVVNNTALRDGGGGYISAGTFSATRGEVSYNTAAYNGGGMRLTGASTLTDASISYNTATSGSGGGVYHAANTLVLNTPVVQGNTAPAGSGGGVYQGAGALTCVGTTSDNAGFFMNSAAVAGGVYLPRTSTFRSTVCGFGDGAASDNTPTDIKNGTKTYNYGNDLTFYCSGGTCR